MRERESERQKNFIFISNHNKWVDSWLVWMALHQSHLAHTLRPIMSDKLAKTPLGMALKIMGAFRAHAGEGLDKSLKTPERYSAEGHSVLIYPEGAPRDGKRETKPGARELSLKTGVPIVPVLINAPPLNAKRIFLENHQVKITIGEPFMPEIDEDVMQRVWQLNDLAPSLVLETGVSMVPVVIKAPIVNIARIYWQRKT